MKAIQEVKGAGYGEVALKAEKKQGAILLQKMIEDSVWKVDTLVNSESYASN